MDRLLIFEAAWRPIADQLGARRDALQVLVMSAEGTLSLDGAPVAGEPAPTLAWASADLFTSPAARDFMVMLLKSASLQWLQSASAGLDYPAFQQLLERGVTVTTSHGQAIPMADYVLWGVLDHLQRGPERRAAQANGAWERPRVREIDGTRWLMVGFGAVGQAVARRAGAFGAEVVGVRRDQSPHELAHRIARPDRLAEELPDADVVVLACPLTDATRRMMNASAFEAMKPGSVIVNVGRGGLVDEPALIAALDAGKPAHALLDVFEVEPLPPESRLWKHPRVTLTAHASGLGQSQNDRNRDLFLENLDLWLKREPLKNVARR